MRFGSSYMHKVNKSQTLLLNEQSRLLEQSGKVYKLGFGQSPFLPPASIIDALREHAEAKEYTAVQGVLELRQAIAKFYEESEGLHYSPDSIFIAPGSKVLLYSMMACFAKADVFIPAPAWVSYVPQAQMLGHQVFQLQTRPENRWRLTPDLLERALASKTNKDVPSILILNYPGNPDGLTYSDDALKALAVVLRQHKVLVIADEIYGLLHHTGEHRSLAHHYPEGTIITSSLSKWCGAGGWRLGVALLPDEMDHSFKNILLGVTSEIYSCAPAPVQFAAIKAYDVKNKEIKSYLKAKREILKALGTEVADRLLKAGIKVSKPEGGFYLLLDFMALQSNIVTHGITTSDELCMRLLADSHVAILPGTAFGMEEEYLSARLAYVDFDGNAALKAALGGEKVDKRFLENYCGKVLEGVDVLCASPLLVKNPGDNLALARSVSQHAI